MKKYSNKPMQRGESGHNNQTTTKSTSNTAMGVVLAMDAYQHNMQQ
jgi:hypothetical protein